MAAGLGGTGGTPLGVAPLPSPREAARGGGSASHWSWAEGLVSQVNLLTWWLLAGCWGNQVH